MSCNRAWIVVAVALFAGVSDALAQETTPTLARSYLLEVQPGKLPEFEAGMKAQIEWYRQNKETWHWHAWEWETGPRTGQFVFRSPGHVWKDLDERSSRTELARAQFGRKVRPHLTSMHGTLTKMLPRVSHWPDDLGEVPMVAVYDFKLNYGTNERFVDVIGRIHDAIQASDLDLAYAWIAHVSGSEVGSFSLVIPYASYADMAPPEKPFWTVIEETVGKSAAAELRGALDECVREETSALARFRPDLSYVPAM